MRRLKIETATDALKYLKNELDSCIYDLEHKPNYSKDSLKAIIADMNKLGYTYIDDDLSEYQLYSFEKQTKVNEVNLVSHIEIELNTVTHDFSIHSYYYDDEVKRTYPQSITAEVFTIILRILNLWHIYKD